MANQPLPSDAPPPQPDPGTTLPPALSPQRPPARHPTRHPWLAASVAASLTLLVDLLIIFTRVPRGNSGYDEVAFHIPAIQRFIEGWPLPDISDYEVAVSPGFHLLMSNIAVLFGSTLAPDELTPFRILTGLFYAGLTGLLAFHLARVAPVVWAIVLATPVIADPYIATGLGLIIPEGFSWLTLAAALALCLARIDWRVVLIAGSVLTFVAVGVRQINLWVAGLFWLIAWLGNPPNDTRRLIPIPHEFQIPRRTKRALIGVGMTLPAFLLIAWFYTLWGGLVPPAFQTIVPGEPLPDTEIVFDAWTQHTGANPSFIPISFAVAGFAGVPFAVMFLGPLRQIVKGQNPRIWLIPIAAIIGASTGLIFETSYAANEGRWGSLWRIAEVTPSFFDRSPAIALLAGAGASVIAIALISIPSRPRLILAAAWAGFVIANSANAQAWVRYIEPFALMWFVFATGEAWRANTADAPDRAKLWRLASPLALTGFLIALSALRVTT